MKVLFRLFLILAILFLTVTVIMLLHWGYDKSLLHFAYFTRSADRLYWLKKLLPVRVFMYFITGDCIIISLLLFILWKFEKIYPPLSHIGTKMMDSILTRWRNDWSWPLFFLILIPVSASVYYTFAMPISLDEAFTHHYFSSRGILASASYYPAPNNHILHSILTNISLLLPLPDTISIRIPAVLAAILSLLFFFSFVKEYYNERIAYMATAVFSVLSMTVYYSFMSRGYALQCLFFILMTYSVFKVLRYPDNKTYWSYFCLSGILGLYTMPSFIYPLISGNLFLLIRVRKLSRYHLTSMLCIIACAACLYLPVILVNDIHPLVTHHPLSPIPRAVVAATMLPFFSESFTDLTGLPLAVVCGLLCAGGAVSIIKRRDRHSWFFVLLLGTVPFLLIMQSAIPFSRTFEYYNCIFSLFTAILLYEICGKYLTVRYSIAGLMMIEALLLFNSDKVIRKKEMYSIETKDVLPRIASGRSFLIYAIGFDEYLIFYFRQRHISGYSLTTYSDDPPKVNLDTIVTGHYDYYIVENNLNETKSRKPIIKTDFYSIYK